jgi:hypothetical protein
MAHAACVCEGEGMPACMHARVWLVCYLMAHAACVCEGEDVPACMHVYG